MISKLRSEWIKDPILRKWSGVKCTDKSTDCKCEDGNHLIELWEQDSCVRGRIDTVVCTSCDSIKTFSIIR